MEGTIQNTYTMVPQVQGKYPIPSIEFNYFDPKKGSYLTLSSVSHMVDVYGGDVSNNSNKNSDNGNLASKINTNQNFGFIKLKSNFSSINQVEFWNKPTYWILIFLPLILLPIIVLLRRFWVTRTIDENNLKLRRRSKLAIKFLGSAKRQINNKSKFYDSLEKAFHNYLKAKLEIETVDIRKESIISSLVKKGASTQNIDSFIKILDNCDMARYSPITDLKMKQDYHSAMDIIEKLDYEI
jgi:hypothetical protein